MEWLTALLTPGFLLGNAVLWVALNNRMHARQWPRVLVRALDVVQMLAIPGFSWLWFRWCALQWWGPPITTPALNLRTQFPSGPLDQNSPYPVTQFPGGLSPGSLASGHLPTGSSLTLQLPSDLFDSSISSFEHGTWWIWTLIVAAQGIAVVALLAWWRRRTAVLPAAVLSLQSRQLDFGAGDGAIRREPFLLAPTQWIPRSEFLQLEITELRLKLSRCPQAWSGLRLAHFSDTHFAGQVPREYFERVLSEVAAMRPDLCLFTGDLLDHPDRVDWLWGTFGLVRAPLGNFYVLGNHDRSNGDVAATRAELADLGWQDCTGRCRIVEHRGHTLAVGGNEQPWLGPPTDWTAAPDDAFRLLLSHTPDHLPIARRDHVDLMLSGHTHGGQVCLPVAGPIFSPSRHGVRYAAGTFWESPTLLHVNRGLSGHSNWRWNCPPELTLLELHAEGPPRKPILWSSVK